MAIEGVDPRRIGRELEGAAVTVDPGLPAPVRAGVEELVRRPLGPGTGPRVHVGPALPELGPGERLLWMHSTNAGVDALLAASAGWPPGTLLTRTVGRMGERIGQYVLAWVLAELQQIPAFLEQQTSRTWNRLPTELADGTLAVVLGTGGIGAGIAAALRPCGVRTVGAARTARPVPGFDEVVALGAPDGSCAPDGSGAPSAELVAALGAARWVVGALPLTPATEGLLGSGFFGAPAGATFLNVGRGATVRTEALGRALEEGRVAHAVLDVLPEEPAGPGAPAWELPRTTLTAHSAGPTTAADVLADFRAAWLALGAGRLPGLAVRAARGY
ncbi:NAD(P)-dependent oxidoreductase [Streptomyces qinglanensis]|uniref:Phosphoglycerate dehydrogenase n=1 Tax=Streptomyces qinglanensis TaxID=943816 RepID=A0A1H9TFK1_9ACTN|nr:NAD(P)-dependent oxidoreductase [Streptomyces qinglanensis]SER95921.1 Phosphoglycerate dehydrogenase [Streptomyces qinglanensis]